MTINNVPGSVGHAQSSTAPRDRQIPFHRLSSPSSGPGWQKKVIGSLGVLLVLAFAVLPTRQAQSGNRPQLEGYGLEGSWINTVSPILPAGAPPVTFRTYVTVAAGGALIGSNPARPFASPVHGTWVHVKGHEYATTSVQDLFDEAGTFLGTFKDRTRVLLVGKDEFVGVANVEQRDPGGNIVLNRCARIHGVRLVVESFTPPCEGLEPGM